MKRSMSRYALKPLHLAVAIALGGIPCIASAQTPASTVTARQSYAVPADSLNTMLLNIARQSGRAISFDPALVKGYKGRAVSGSMTVEQAVAACLQGSDLALDVTSNGTLTVTRAAQPVNVQPTNVTGSDAQLPEIAVTGAALSEDQLYYNPMNSSTVSRSDMALKQTAQSVEVISGKLIKDRQATDLSEVLKGSAGVQQTVNGQGGQTYTIRGFNVQQTSTNGISNPGINGTPIQGIERVEVIKGPDSIMSGSSTPGGTINIVRKAPVVDDLRTLTLEAADDGELKQGIDLGGAINADKTLSYRFNMSNKQSDKAEPDFDGQREFYIAPALTWDNDSTRLTVGAELSNTRTAAPRTTVAIDGDVQKLPRNRLFRKEDGFVTKSKTGYYEFKQDLGADWSFNSKANYLDSTDDIHLWQIGLINSDGTVGFANPFAAKSHSVSWSTQNDFRGKIQTGFITHKLLAGMDYQHIDSTQDERSVPGESGDFPDVSIYNPSSIDTLPAFGGPTYRSSKGRLQQRGLIFQDQMDIGERTHVLLAAKRATWISESTAYGENGGVFGDSSVTSKKWVPNYGISFDISKEMTVYANLLHGFSGSSSSDPATGQVLAPETSKSKEVGAKFNLLNDSLTITTAYFELQQDNVPISDPVTGNLIGSQSQSSKGYDLNVSGEIMPGWGVSASYTHVKFDEPGLATGDISTFSGQPTNVANVWTSYEIQEGSFKGLGAGIGVDAFNSTTGGSSDGSYALPGGATTDLSFFYHARDYSLTLGIKNVFDRELYYSSSTAAFIPLRPDRNARLTFSYNF